MHTTFEKSFTRYRTPFKVLKNLALGSYRLGISFLPKLVFFTTIIFQSLLLVIFWQRYEESTNIAILLWFLEGQFFCVKKSGPPNFWGPS